MDGREGAILKIDGDWVIRFERRLKHAPERVWRAITGPGEMSRWFDQTEMPQPLKVGAVIRFYHSVVDQWSEGLITDLDPPRVIEWLWSSGFGPTNPMRWDITPEPDGCRLVMRQTVGDEVIIARTTAGWHVCLDRMQAAIEDAPDSGGMDVWLPRFEIYKARLPGLGVTTPQAGAPPKPPPKD